MRTKKRPTGALGGHLFLGATLKIPALTAPIGSEFLQALHEAGVRRVLRPRTVMPQRPRGRRVTASNAWQEWEIALLGTALDRKVARQIGRSYPSVAKKRKKWGFR
jgi:hypothetical protein